MKRHSQGRRDACLALGAGFWLWPRRRFRLRGGVFWLWCGCSSLDSVLIPPLERERGEGGRGEPTKYNYSAEDLGEGEGRMGGRGKSPPRRRRSPRKVGRRRRSCNGTLSLPGSTPMGRIPKGTVFGRGAPGLPRGNAFPLRTRNNAVMEVPPSLCFLRISSPGVLALCRVGPYFRQIPRMNRRCVVPAALEFVNRCVSFFAFSATARPTSRRALPLKEGDCRTGSGRWRRSPARRRGASPWAPQRRRLGPAQGEWLPLRR